MLQRFLLIAFLAGTTFTQQPTKGSLELQLIDPAGAVVNHAEVLVFERDKTNPVPSSSRPDSNGLVRMELAAANYDIVVRSASGFAPWAKEAAIAAKETKRLTAVLQVAGCEVAIACDSFEGTMDVRLTIIDAKGAPARDAEVIVIDKKDLWITHLHTDSRGRVTTALAEGEYKVMAQLGSKQAADRDIYVPLTTESVEESLKLRCKSDCGAKR